jgi:hypothetical protein
VRGLRLVRLLIRSRARISAPRAVGSGRVRIKPGKIRAGDRLVARIPLRAAALRRARRRRVPTLRAGKLRVTARARGLSSAELTRLVLALQAQVEALSRRLDELASRNASELAALRDELAALAAQADVLEAGVAALQTALEALSADLNARIAGLEGDSSPSWPSRSSTSTSSRAARRRSARRSPRSSPTSARWRVG